MSDRDILEFSARVIGPVLAREPGMAERVRHEIERAQAEEAARAEKGVFTVADLVIRYVAQQQWPSHEAITLGDSARDAAGKGLLVVRRLPRGLPEVKADTRYHCEPRDFNRWLAGNGMPPLDIGQGGGGLTQEEFLSQVRADMLAKIRERRKSPSALDMLKAMLAEKKPASPSIAPPELAQAPGAVEVAPSSAARPEAVATIAAPEAPDKSRSDFDSKLEEARREIEDRKRRDEERKGLEARLAALPREEEDIMRKKYGLPYRQRPSAAPKPVEGVRFRAAVVPHDIPAENMPREGAAAPSASPAARPEAVSASAAPEAPDSASTPADGLPGAVAVPADAGRPRGIKKSVMVERHKKRWPTIESDLTDASTNGLSARARAGKRGWIEAEALAWAEDHGRLTAAPEPNSLPAVMGNFTSSVHRLRR